MCNHPKQEADDDKALERIQKSKAEDRWAERERERDIYINIYIYIIYII